MASDCIFCEIVRGEAPSYKIYEDKDAVAFLDIFPAVRGQTVVIPKRHKSSYVFDLKDKELSDFISTVKKVAKLLEGKLGAERINLLFEGVEVSHLHAKLYPDFINSRIGKRASDDALRRVQKQITGR